MHTSRSPFIGHTRDSSSFGCKVNCGSSRLDVVLSYLRTLPDNEALSFQVLSHKLAILMALVNADRCSDLASLDLGYRSFQGNGVRFVIPGLMKTRRLGPPTRLFILSSQRTQISAQYRPYGPMKEDQKDFVPNSRI